LGDKIKEEERVVDYGRYGIEEGRDLWEVWDRRGSWLMGGMG